ncbi:MAG: sigma 54-interacting transcriptional regulator [Planctomycetes bacterium]|nr:sigma 54-interacting transcriptional regulator [Planctomycetota bacterium]
MKPGDLVGDRLRATAPLGARGEGASLLVCERRRGRRRRWVLRWIPSLVDTPLRARVRPDLLDLASLKHETLALPIRFGRDPRSERPFLLRPYIEGSNLLVAAQARSPRDLLPWMVAAAEALGILHAAGYLHRAVKAENFIVPRASLFARSSRTGSVVLCDPAIHRDGLEAGPLSSESAAPEIRAGEPASIASDLYALGVIFYRILTRRNPGGGEGDLPPPPRRWNPEIPVDLERSVMNLLQPEPARRYRDVPTLLDDLRSLCGPRAPHLPAPPDGFLGRGEELARCLARLQACREPVALAITGEAGVGRSAFLDRLALEVQLDGFSTVAVRCYPETSRPLGAIHDLAEKIIPPGIAGRSLRARCRKCLAPAERQAVSASARGTIDPRRRAALLRELVSIFCDAAAGSRTLLLVDDVHLADSLMIELLAALVCEIGFAARRETPAETPPPSLAVSLPGESASRSGLRPLLDALQSPGGPHLVLDLPPLGRDAIEEWLGMALGTEDEERERILGFCPDGGNPFEIREVIRLGPSGVGIAAAAGSDLKSMRLEYIASLTGERRETLELLAVLGRPASTDLLAALVKTAAVKLRMIAEPLVREGTLGEEGGVWFFQHNSFQAWLLRTLPEKRSKALHRRVAEILERRGEGAVEEVARHWLDSETPRKGVDAALKAARRHLAAHEAKRALRFYPRVLALLPPDPAPRRRAVAEETAEAFARTGDYSRAIEILTELLDASRDDRDAGRLHGRIGVYHHQTGNLPRSVSHLEQGKGLLQRFRGRDVLRQRLRIESELAEIASHQGRYDRAEEICQDALAQLVKSGKAREDPEVRREEMVLLETQAHFRLRRFQFREAREYFERSLELSEELEAAPERGLILNNLGILHNQENRFPQAIECYRKAEKISARLGDAQSLAAIHCNLAVLHAKTGDVDAADEAIRRAARSEAQCDSRRARFLRLHSSGLVNHLSGRYASAVECFRAAIDLGSMLKDQHTVAFDLVYLGECHIYRGEGRSAQAALDQALSIGSALPPPVMLMVKARSGLLAALRGEVREAQTAWAGFEETPSREIGYLDAGNRLFVGWSRRLCGLLDEAEADLEYARAFFSRKKLQPAEIHAALELSACDLDAGRAARAERRLAALRSRFTCGQGVLKNPMLAARFLAAQTRLLLEMAPPDYQEASTVLVEAESYLIGRHLQELESQVRQLKRRLHVATLESGSSSLMPQTLSRYSLDGVDLLSFLKTSAADLVRRFEEEIGSERAESLRHHLRDFEQHLDETRRRLEGRSPAIGELVRSDALIGRSVAMRQVVSLIRQIAPSHVPVLVRGETGTGKELVARAIHGESPRSAKPFVSLNCAALPAELLEAELFGHEPGAFTGAEEEREGLLRSARGGTFFFDEVGDLPFPLQAKLLQLLDRSKVRPLGGTEEIAIDVRFIFSSHRDLPEMVKSGEFRQDLFYRLGSFEIFIPPLRERLEDLPELVNHFRSLVKGEGGHLAFDPEVLRRLASHSWPGNVRELRNVVFRLVLTAGDDVSGEDVTRAMGQSSPEGLFSTALLRGRSFEELQSELEREYLAQLHADCGGDLKAMARRLGIKLRALYDRFKRIDLRPRDLARGDAGSGGAGGAADHGPPARRDDAEGAGE